MAGRRGGTRSSTAIHASVDWPGCRFWRDLASHYPDAKVVLTIRDPADWYESISNTIYPWFVRGPGADEGQREREALAAEGEGADRQADVCRRC